MRIFIADDSPDVRERLVRQIADLNMTEDIIQAGNAPAALEAVRTASFNVVIVDIRMPGGNGIQVLEAAKARNPAPLVIVLTSFPYPQYYQKAIELGADYFFDKTIEFEKVTEVILALKGKPELS